MKSWFLSDLHLTDSNERNGNILLRFLFELNENPKGQRLFLLGDIFDVWVSSSGAFEKRFQPIVDQIVKFKQGGGEVFYFEGNHDFHLDVFWTKKYDIPVIEDGADFNLEGLRVRVEHGDFISDDKAYLKYRAFVRTKPIEFFAHFLSGHFWQWIGGKQSRGSRKRTSRYASQNSEGIRKKIRKYAESNFRKYSYDLIVTGHMHIFDDYEFTGDDRKIRSINLGTWLETPRILKLENKKIEIVLL